MSARQFQGRRQQGRKPQSKPKRQGIRNNLPSSNMQNAVRQSQNRIRNIKSPFARDQTRTISNRPNPTKRRAVGQIPLRDRQNSKIKANQPQSSGIVIKPQKAVRQKKIIKKAPKRKPNQFNKKNKSKSEINQVFNFDENERSFF